MYIKHDMSYLSNGKELIEKGYADLDIYSLHFDRYFTEEEKENNKRIADNLRNNTEEWNKHCDNISKMINQNLIPIIEMLNNKYYIRQYTKEKNSTEHYRSNWDLFFYNNRGWNKKDYFDYMSLSFNKKRTVEENQKLLNDILEMLKELKVENVYCRVQYKIRLKEKEIKEKVNNICESLLNEFVEYQGMTGKIKIIGERNNRKIYGFFKKGSKKTYYRISDTDTYLVLKYA